MSGDLVRKKMSQSPDLIKLKLRQISPKALPNMNACSFKILEDQSQSEERKKVSAKVYKELFH